jgi:hypothetical protein
MEAPEKGVEPATRVGRTDPMRSDARRLVFVAGLVAVLVGPWLIGERRNAAVAQAQTAIPASDEPVLAATRGTAREPWLARYDPASRRLSLERYAARGLERRGAREVTWDLRLEELNPRLAADGRLSEGQLRARLEKDPPSGAAPTPESIGIRVALAATKGPSQEPWVFLFDATSDRLAAYRAGDLGIELKGVRRITWDLMLEELDPRRTAGGSRVRVAGVRKAMEEQGREPGPEGSPDHPRDILLAAVRDPSGAAVAILYDVKTRRLAAYRSAPQGLELRGLRTIQWDLRLGDDGPLAFPSRVPVQWVRAEVERTKSSGPAEPEEPSATEPGGTAPRRSSVWLAVTQGSAEEPWILIEDDGAQRLAMYSVGNLGIALRAIRRIESTPENADSGESDPPIRSIPIERKKPAPPP